MCRCHSGDYMTLYSTSGGIWMCQNVTNWLNIMWPYEKNCDISFIWKSILSAQRWYLVCANWMQHCNFIVNNRSLFLFIFFVFPHKNGLISWNAFNWQVPCLMWWVTYYTVAFFIINCLYFTWYSDLKSWNIPSTPQPLKLEALQYLK